MTKKLISHILLWIVLLIFAYIFVDTLYVEPITRWASSLKEGVLLSLVLTVFYIGLFKVLGYIYNGFNWILDNL